MTPMDVNAGHPSKARALATGGIAPWLLAPTAPDDTSGLNDIPTADAAFDTSTHMRGLA